MIKITVFCNEIILHTALTFRGGKVVVMEAFGTHFMKEISRGQLTTAAKSFLSSKQRTWAAKRASSSPPGEGVPLPEHSPHS